jgi:hypothetical protein
VLRIFAGKNEQPHQREQTAASAKSALLSLAENEVVQEERAVKVGVHPCCDVLGDNRQLVTTVVRPESSKSTSRTR